MTFIKTSQGDVFHQIQGKGSKLMLLHADYASSREFEALFPELIKKFQVITMDYPGCGRSPRRALSYDYYKENAKAAVDIIRAKDLDPVWVIGSGGGAITALWMAIMAPSKIRGVIADSFTEFYEKKDIQRDLAAHEDPTPQMVDFFADMNGDDWQMVISQVDRVLAQMSEQNRSVFNWRLEDVKCPVLITASKTDHLISNIEPKLEAVAEQIQNCKLIFYPEGEHPSMWSQKKDFWKDAKEFIFANEAKNY